MLLLWGQLCNVPYDLRHQDFIWVENARTWSALAKLHSLRDVRSGLPIRLRSLPSESKFSLLSLCHEGENTYWKVVRGEDTLLWVSARLSPRWLKRNLTFFQGPRTWRKAHPPYREIELFLPIAPRPQVPEDSLWQLNQAWVDSFILPWVQTLQLPKGRLTGISIELRQFPKRIRQEKVAVYLQRHPELRFDEKAHEVPVKRLPFELRQRFYLLYERSTAYAYVVRIQDYYPERLEEARRWLEILRRKEPFPLPVEVSGGSFTEAALLPR